MKAQNFSKGVIDTSFTAEISEIKATNSRIEEELGHIRSRMDDYVRENHTLRAKANKLHHDLQILKPQNKSLHNKLVQKRVGITGVIQILSSLQTEGSRITLNTY
jgi:uncharacterized coiled-coil DUF342 family protein